MADGKPVRIRIVLDGIRREDASRLVSDIDRATKEAAARARKNLAGVLLDPRAKIVPSGRGTAADVKTPPGAKHVASRRARIEDLDYSRIGRDADRAGRSVEKFAKHVHSSRGALVQLASAVYLFRSFAGAVDALLVAPLRRLSAALIEANENRQKFVNSLSGVAGLDRARAIDRALIRQLRGTPVSMAEGRASAQALTFIPALSQRIAVGSPQDAAREAMRFTDLARRLGVIDPRQGTQGAVTALRELAEGDSISLRRRFGFDISQLARMVGRDEAELRTNPALSFQAVEKLVDVLLPPGAADRASKLISVRVAKLRDALEDSLAEVAEQGVFDRTSDRLARVADEMFAYFDSDDFRRMARGLSADLDRIVGNVGQALNRLLRKLAGAPVDTSTVKGTVDGIGEVLNRLARLSDNLPDVFSKVGAIMGSVAGKLAAFVDAVILLGEAARDPAGYVSGIGRRAVTPGPTTGQRVAGDVDGQMLEILKSAGIDTGAIGRTHYDPKTTSDHVYKELRGDGAGFAHATGAAVLETFRDALGSNAPVTELSFASLPPHQRLTAQRIYDALRETGDAPAELVAKLRGATTRPTIGPEADFGPISRIIRDEVGSPNFLATLQGQGSALSQLADLSPDLDALARLRDAAVPALSTEPLALINRQLRDSLAVIDPALEDARTRLAVEDHPELRRQIADVEKLRQGVLDAFNVAADQARGGIVKGASNLTRALADQFADVPLSSDFQRQLAAGRTLYADRVIDRLDLPDTERGKIGLDGFPLSEGLAFAARMAQRREADAELSGRIGKIAPGLSADQIAGAGRLDTTGIARAKFYALRDALPVQEGLLTRANAELKDPADPLAIRDAAVAAERYGELLARLRELRIEADPLASAFYEFGESARLALESGLGDAIYNLITGTGTLRDALVGFAQDVTRAFSQIMANRLIYSLIGDAMLTTPNGPGQLGGLLGAIVKPKAMAAGGVVHGATAAIIGEGRWPEAVVPLPDGRSIPLATRGGETFAELPGGRYVPAKFYADGGVLNGRSYVSPGALRGPASFDAGRGDRPAVYVVQDAAQAVREGFRQNKDVLVSMLSRNVASGHGQLGKTIRRKAS